METKSTTTVKFTSLLLTPKETVKRLSAAPQGTQTLTFKSLL